MVLFLFHKAGPIISIYFQAGQCLPSRWSPLFLTHATIEFAPLIWATCSRLHNNNNGTTRLCTSFPDGEGQAYQQRGAADGISKARAWYSGKLVAGIPPACWILISRMWGLPIAMFCGHWHAQMSLEGRDPTGDRYQQFRRSCDLSFARCLSILMLIPILILKLDSPMPSHSSALALFMS